MVLCKGKALINIHVALHTLHKKNTERFETPIECDKALYKNSIHYSSWREFCSSAIQFDPDSSFYTSKVRPLVYICAVFQLLAYVVGLIFTLKTHSHIIQEQLHLPGKKFILLMFCKLYLFWSWCSSTLVWFVGPWKFCFKMWWKSMNVYYFYFYFHISIFLLLYSYILSFFQGPNIMPVFAVDCFCCWVLEIIGNFSLLCSLLFVRIVL